MKHTPTYNALLFTGSRGTTFLIRNYGCGSEMLFRNCKYNQ